MGDGGRARRVQSREPGMRAAITRWNRARHWSNGCRSADARRRRVHLRRAAAYRRPEGQLDQGRGGEEWRAALGQAFAQAQKCKGRRVDCYSARSLVKEVFLDSDTDAGVVSALFGTDDGNPTPIAYASRSARAHSVLGGGKHRALIHGGVLPNLPGEIDAMAWKASHKVSAWKLYPQWGPDGAG